MEDAGTSLDRRSVRDPCVSAIINIVCNTHKPLITAQQTRGSSSREATETPYVHACRLLNIYAKFRFLHLEIEEGNWKESGPRLK